MRNPEGSSDNALNAVKSEGPGYYILLGDEVFLRGCAGMGKAKEAVREAIPRMNANPKSREIIQVLPRVIAFDLEGEGETFALVVKDSNAVILSDDTGDAEIVVGGDAAEFAKIVTREREVTHAVAEGKVWLTKGKLSRMILFDRLLNLSRKKR